MGRGGERRGVGRVGEGTEGGGEGEGEGKGGEGRGERASSLFKTYMGIGKFQPPTKSIPLNQSTKNSAQLIMSARGTPIPNLVQIHPVRVSGQVGEI